MKFLTEHPLIIFLGLVATIGGVVSLARDSLLWFGFAVAGALACIVLVWIKRIDSPVEADVGRHGEQLLETDVQVERGQAATSGIVAAQVESRPQHVFPYDVRPSQAYYRQAFKELNSGKIVNMERAVWDFCDDFERWINFQVASYIDAYPGADRDDIEQRYYMTGIELAYGQKLGDDMWRALASHVKDRVFEFTRRYGSPNVRK